MEHPPKSLICKLSVHITSVTLNFPYAKAGKGYAPIPLFFFHSVLLLFLQNIIHSNHSSCDFFGKVSWVLKVIGNYVAEMF